MTTYEIDFEYRIKEFGTVNDIVADSSEDAEYQADKYIKEFYPDVEDVEITSIREIG